MPTYRVIDKSTLEEHIEEMKMSEVDDFLKNNPNLDILPPATPINFNDLKKPDQGFRDRLREIKKSHFGANINTF